jgi:hypothetical protein
MRITLAKIKNNEIEDAIEILATYTIKSPRTADSIVNRAVKKFLLAFNELIRSSIALILLVSSDIATA